MLPVYIVSNPTEFENMMQTLNNAPVIGIDTEYSITDLLLVSFCDGLGSFVIDFTALDPYKYIPHLKQLLESNTTLKVGHNLVAEWTQFFKYGDIRMDNLFDTMVMERMIRAGLQRPADLKSVVKRYLDIEMDKDIRDDFINWQIGVDEFSEDHLLYSGHDAHYPLLIMEKQQALIERFGLQRIADLENKVVTVTGLMKATGVPINIEKLESMVEPFQRYQRTVDQAFQDIVISNGAADSIYFDEYGYRAINTASNDQVKKLFGLFGIDIRNKKNEPSLSAQDMIKWDIQQQNSKRKNSKAIQVDYNDIIEDEDVLDALDTYTTYDNKVLRAFSYVNAVNKIYSTFIKGILDKTNRDTRRIYPNFNSYGASATGRYSSSAPNFQNLPNDGKLSILGFKDHSIRQCVEPTENNRLIIADYSGIELVILAVLSKDNDLMNLIKDGDVHTAVAKAVFNVPDMNESNKKVGKYKLYRDAAKKVSYSIAYGTTGVHLAEVLNVALAELNLKKYSAKDGEAIIESWFKLFPRVRALLDANAKKAVEKLFVTDVWGRRRNWDRRKLFSDDNKQNNRLQSAAGREGKNMPIQGTSATMTKLAMRYFYDQADYKQARIIITVHDEIVVETTVEYAETAQNILKNSMEQAIRDTLVDIASDVGKYESLSVSAHISRKYDK
jgi:DNA polymerase I-like protein with 3'-5' exonuclease and polymerase domains